MSTTITFLNLLKICPRAQFRKRSFWKNRSTWREWKRNSPLQSPFSKACCRTPFQKFREPIWLPKPSHPERWEEIILTSPQRPMAARSRSEERRVGKEGEGEGG